MMENVLGDAAYQSFESMNTAPSKDCQIRLPFSDFRHYLLSGIAESMSNLDVQALLLKDVPCLIRDSTDLLSLMLFPLPLVDQVYTRDACIGIVAVRHDGEQAHMVSVWCEHRCDCSNSSDRRLRPIYRDQNLHEVARSEADGWGISSGL
jgi:hypothetical protein